MDTKFDVQALESRKLLSVTLSDTTLLVSGSSGNDQIEVTSDGGVTSVNDNGDKSTFNNNDFDKIDIRTADGNDTIRLDQNVVGKSYVDGGDGNNVIDLSPATDGVNITTEIGWQWQNIGTLRGSSGDDTIDLFSQFDTGIKVVEAGDGNDTVTLFRTAEGATVNGGDGDDTLQVSDPGFDAVYLGGSGNDTFLTYRSSRTNRDFHGGAGTDTVDYTPFNTSTVLVTIDDQANDGVLDGNDVRGDNVHADIEVVIGGQLDDTLIGSNNDETLIGGLGNDSLDGNGGNDSLDGGGGDDTIVPNVGNDDSGTTTDGGENSTTEPAPTTPAPVPVRTPQRVALTSSGVLNITGTTKNDKLTITQASTSALNVTLNGKTTRIPLKGVSQVAIDGGNGNDRISFDAKVRLATRINGGAGNDTIYGDSGNDRINGGDGNDYINSGSGNDVVFGDAGNDQLFGGSGKDRIYAGSGVDVLRGGAGTDQLYVAVAKRADVRDNAGDRIIHQVL